MVSSSFTISVLLSVAVVLIIGGTSHHSCEARSNPIIPPRVSCDAASFAHRRNNCRSSFITNNNNIINSNNVMLRIRGGEADLLAVESSDYDADDDENDENNDTQEQYDDEEDDEEESEEEESEKEESEEEESDSEEESLSPEKDNDKTPLVLPPVRVIVRTSLQCGIVDQTLEFTASRKRDVTSIKQSIARQMRGRPPMSSQILRIANRIVSDDETVHSLLEDYDEEEENDEDDDEDNDDKTLTLILDVPPPVDPKFATELGRQLQQMTATQILDAYVTNMAVLHSNAVAMLEEDNDDATAHSNTNPPPPTLVPHSVTMKRHALTLRQRLTEQFPPKVLDLLTTQQQETTNDNNNQDDDQDDMTERSLKAKHRRKTSMRGGAKMTVKRALQRNLNINWPDTVRNTLLFVFFGHFGGKSETSRALLLAMAPLCFLLQLRCVKIYLKQIFYAIGKPPGILLSLLPAPQQAIMAFHMPNSMRAVYGIEMGSGVGDNNDDEDEDDTEEDDDASIGEEEKDEEHDGAYDEEYDEEY